MSTASKKKRQGLRQDWLNLVQAERDVSFQVYKERLGILPAIQKRYKPEPGKQAPHEQGQVSA
jgi:hypothetical protein